MATQDFLFLTQPFYGIVTKHHKNINKTQKRKAKMRVLLQMMSCLFFYTIVIHGAYADKQTPNTPTVQLSKRGHIAYKGPITTTGYELLKKFYLKSKEKVDSPALIIASLGGDFEAGMAMGRFIHDKKMVIKVMEICSGSCANYIFPAATTKYLGTDAVVTFIQNSIETKVGKVAFDEVLNAKIPPQAKRISDVIYTDTLNKISHINSQNNVTNDFSTCISKIKIKNKPKSHTDIQTLYTKYLKNQVSCVHKIEKEFYNEIGVDFRLPALGLKKLKLAKEDNNKILFYYYDFASLKSLGVSNVRITKGWSASKNRHSQRMIKVTQEDWL